MNINKNLLGSLAVMIFGNMVWAETVIELKAYLKQGLAGSASLTKELFNLSLDQKNQMKKIAAESSDDSFVFYYGKSAQGKLEIACTVVSQQGKEGPMTIGVCFDPSGLVNKVTILEFSEERGKPVKEQTFLKQFNGKKVSDAFQVGKDIDGISGATISSKAVSEAVRKAGFAFKTFVKK